MSFPAPAAATRVLMVNDDVSVSDMFCRTLRLEGFEVWGALSPSEGLTLADRHRPHAIILDLRTPLGCSIDLLRGMRLLTGMATTPAAIVTGDYYVESTQTELIRSLGATLHFKPLWLTELAGVARELVHAGASSSVA